MISLVRIPVSLLPIVAFLIALVFLDSFKLVRTRLILSAIIAGMFSALASMYINGWLLYFLHMSATSYTRNLAPVIEECIKALFVIYLLRIKRVGFLVDAAIYGFAVGVGFALVENVYYLYSISDNNVMLWIVRGFGTAALHSGTVAMFAILSKGLSDRYPRHELLVYVPGLLLAIVTHVIFNYFILPPLMMTVTLLIVISLLLVVTFARSEAATREWLGVGIDHDMQLLETIMSGKIPETPIGEYLDTLRTRFPGPVVADMLCLLRIHLELSVQAKGILLMKEAGLKPTVDSEIRQRFDEMKYLEQSIGTTGKLAMHPFMHRSSRDLWQIYTLQ